MLYSSLLVTFRERPDQKLILTKRKKVHFLRLISFIVKALFLSWNYHHYWDDPRHNPFGGNNDFLKSSSTKSAFPAANSRLNDNS